MALVSCDECGHTISSKASACPNCGAPVANQPEAPADFDAALKKERERHNLNVLGLMATTFCVSMAIFWVWIGMDFTVSAIVSLVLAGGSVTPVWKV